MADAPTPQQESADEFLKRIKSKSQAPAQAPVDAQTAPTVTAPTAPTVQAAPAATTPPTTATQESADDFLRRIKGNAGVKEEQPTDESGDYWKSIKQGFVRGVAGVAGTPGYLLNSLAPAMQFSPQGLMQAFGGQKLRFGAQQALTGSDQPSEGNLSMLHPGPVPTPESYLQTAVDKGWYDPKFSGATFGSRFAGDMAAATPNLLVGPYGLESAAYTYGPAALASIGKEFGLPEWLTAPSAALGMSGGQRVASNVIERNAAIAAEQQAKAALAAHQAGKPAAAEQAQTEVAGSKTLSKGVAAATTADVMKRHDSEHMAADNDRETVAASLGDSHTLDEGMEKLQDSARDWKKTDFKTGIQEAEDGMYYKPGTNNTQTLIPEDAPTSLKGFMDALEHSHYSAGEAEPLAELLQPYLPKAMLARVRAMQTGQGLTEDVAPTIPFRDARKLSSALGAALDNQKIIADTGAGKLNELYASLQGDKRAAIQESAGQEGLDQFDKFNAEAKRLYGIASGPVSDVIGNVDKTVDKITPQMARDKLGYDSAKLRMLTTEPKLDKGLKEYGAPHLRLGTPLGDPGDADKVFSGMSPNVKGPLFGDVNAGKVQDTIDSRAEADKNLETSKQNIKEQSQSIRDREAAFQRRQRRERQETGTGLKQTAEAAKENKNALTDPTQGIYEMLRHGGRTATGIATGLVAGHYGLEPGLESLAQSAQLPGWLSKLAYPAFAGAGYLGAEGLKELTRNPQASVNMLRGTLAAAPWAPSKPSGSTP
jgi:hypothetical protein